MSNNGDTYGNVWGVIMREVASLICLINIRGGGRWMPAAITDDCLHPHKSDMDILKLYNMENSMVVCAVPILVLS